jgi:acyl carrier protein
VSAENTLKEILNKVLDVKPDEIELEESLERSLGVDSTEMVEITVGLKKALGIQLADNEIKKSHSFNQIVGILKSKGVGV